MFRYDGSAWIEKSKLLAFDGAAEDRFANSVAVAGDLALVGASGDDNKHGQSAGSAYLFVPEPATLALRATALAVLAFLARRRAAWIEFSTRARARTRSV